MAAQGLVHYSAACFECNARCTARNAQAWAHNHTNRTGHNVELQLGWIIRCDAAGANKQAGNDLT